MMAGVYLDRLPSATRETLDQVARIANVAAMRPYLVGGAVRDLLIGLPVTDIDVVIEGDARVLATSLASAVGARLTAHESFYTAVLHWPDGRRLDLTTARSETYPAPGALPIVTPGNLVADLRRRDFTINAIAIDLSGPHHGQLIDPLRGEADLRRGLIRILHDGSFRDDPTRLLRAVRYEQRLSATIGGAGQKFELEAGTARAFSAAVADRCLRAVSGDRRAAEFRRLLLEPAACGMLDRLAHVGLLDAISAGFVWDETRRRHCDRLPTVLAWIEPGDEEVWLARLGLLLPAAAESVMEALARDVRLSARGVKSLTDITFLRHVIPRLERCRSDSELGALLDPFAPVALAVTAVTHPRVRAVIERYLRHVRGIRPILSGDFLRARGIAPGPAYRDALAELLHFKRDAPEASEAEEVAFLEQWLVKSAVGR